MSMLFLLAFSPKPSTKEAKLIQEAAKDYITSICALNGITKIKFSTIPSKGIAWTTNKKLLAAGAGLVVSTIIIVAASKMTVAGNEVKLKKMLENAKAYGSKGLEKVKNLGGKIKGLFTKKETLKDINKKINPKAMEYSLFGPGAKFAGENDNQEYAKSTSTKEDTANASNKMLMDDV